MRLVVDTNVVVSALLHPGRTPDQALAAARRQGAVFLADARMEAEYRDVLGRPKLRAIEPVRREALLASLLDGAERVASAQPFVGAMIDDDDRVFVEVALAGGADAVVTGNAKHFPRGLGVDILSPSELLSLLSAPER